MKSIVALVLAGLILGSSLLPGFSIDQSAKWVELMQHYEQHRASDAQLSFMDFLAMHYGANSEHQKHPKHSHQNLPTGGHTIPVFSPNSVRLHFSSAVGAILANKTAFFRKADLYSFLSVFSLINPPRTVIG
ncbi:hypothetical protein [Spirosoma radiotolerans]|uniref:Uncharacterized protein n=1 Tax=Spirosoma radiotolerans TaxID=1379870 RepID=A0A0E3V8C8_9BACT|nr:hypothetical protein [Spirosoma radiotolerans]AKD56191.1 hypothetical protein SD10_16075 [Spirosoma radiotolerans]